MAERYEDRYRGEEYRGERGYGREDRGFFDRAGDQVRSWLGDEEAERRRRMDERERERQPERSYGRDYGPGYDYGRGSERGWGEPYRGEQGRAAERWGGGEGGRSSGGAGFGGADYGRWDTEYRAGRDREVGRTGYRDEPYAYGTRYGGGYTGTYGTTGSARAWTERGDFSGRGPKGYQRSDSRINEDVCDRLTEAPDIDASNIEVRVSNGEVTLSGIVRDRLDKRRVEDVIESISGVREVHNNLRVGRPNEGIGGTAGVAGPAAASQGPTTRR